MRWSKAFPVSAALLVMVVVQAWPSVNGDQLVYRKKYAMGTVFEIAAYGPFARPDVACHRTGIQ